MREGGFVSGTNMTRKDEFDNAQKELNKKRNSKNDLRGKIKDLQDELDDLETERSNLLKQMVPRHDTIQKVEQGVKDLENQMNTRTMNANQEAKLIKGIARLN